MLSQRRPPVEDSSSSFHPKPDFSSLYTQAKAENAQNVSKARKAARVAGCCSLSIIYLVLMLWFVMVVISSFFIRADMAREYATADFMVKNTCSMAPGNTTPEHVLESDICTKSHNIYHRNWSTEFLARLVEYHTGPVRAFMELGIVQWFCYSLLSNFGGTLASVTGAILTLYEFYRRVIGPLYQDYGARMQPFTEGLPNTT